MTSVNEMNAVTRERKKVRELFRTDPVAFMQEYIDSDFTVTKYQRDLINQMIDNSERSVKPPLVTKANAGEDLNEGDAVFVTDGVALKNIKHPQMTPWWKRVLTFFKRPRLSEANLEKNHGIIQRKTSRKTNR